MAFLPGFWGLYSNGFALGLYISLEADLTTVSGTITEGNQSTSIQAGKWDDTLSKIDFKRAVLDNEGHPTGELQSYTGFLFDQEVTVLVSSPTSVMAGTFTSEGGFENPAKAASGWGWFAYYGSPGPG